MDLADKKRHYGTATTFHVREQAMGALARKIGPSHLFGATRTPLGRTLIDERETYCTDELIGVPDAAAKPPMLNQLLCPTLALPTYSLATMGGFGTC